MSVYIENLFEDLRQVGFCTGILDQMYEALTCSQTGSSACSLCLKKVLSTIIIRADSLLGMQYHFLTGCHVLQ